MENSRKAEIRNLFWQHLAGIVQDDLDGRTQSFKEAWEQCNNQEELQYGKQVLMEILMEFF